MAIHKRTLFVLIILVYAAYKSYPVNPEWQMPISFRSPMPHLTWAYRILRFIIKKATWLDWISFVCVVVGFIMPTLTIICFIRMCFVPAVSEKPDVYTPVAIQFFLTVVYSGVMVQISKPKSGTPYDLLILSCCATALFVFVYKFICALKALTPSPEGDRHPENAGRQQDRNGNNRR